jgi:hypothetical protein
VIAESTQIASLRRIYKLTLVQGHEVKVFDALFVVLSHPTPELLLSDHLSNILEDQLVRVEIRFRSESEAFFIRFDDRDFCVLFLLEPLIPAVLAALAVSHALDFGRSVDAIGVFATCQVLFFFRV